MRILYQGSPLQHMFDPGAQGGLAVGQPRRWERVYHDYYGSGFPEPALDRQEWKKTESDFTHHLMRRWRFESRPAS